MSRMNRRGDSPSRSEITGNVERGGEEMRAKEAEEDTLVVDVETVRRTIDSLEMIGAEEDARDIEDEIEAAEDVTVDIFDQTDEELEAVQAESETYQGELEERSESSESDLEKISDAQRDVSTDATLNELSEASEANKRGIEFLHGNIEQAKKFREESEQRQKEYQARVRSDRRR